MPGLRPILFLSIQTQSVHSFTPTVVLITTSTLSPTIFSHSIQTLKNCLNGIPNFKLTNKLKLSHDKTEVILIKQLLSHFQFNIIADHVSPAQIVKNLGVVFDSNFTLSYHVSQVIKSTRVHATDLYRNHILKLKISSLSKCFGGQQIELLQFHICITH